jgi:hypothetical protein
VYTAVVTQLYFQIVEEISYMFWPFSGWAIIRLKLEISQKTHTHCNVDCTSRMGERDFILQWLGRCIAIYTWRGTIVKQDLIPPFLMYSPHCSVWVFSDISSFNLMMAHPEKGRNIKLISSTIWKYSCVMTAIYTLNFHQYRIIQQGWCHQRWSTKFTYSVKIRMSITIYFKVHCQ